MTPQTEIATVKLDAKTIAGLTLPDGKDDDVKWDDELPKFGLRLRRSGKRTLKTWVVQYRVNGKRGKATFGDARIVPVTKAREAARKHLAEVSLGYDPQAERAAKRRAAELTFAKVAETYLEDCRPRFRPNSFKKAKTYLTRPFYFKPLHARGVSEISFSDVAACVRDIEKNRGSITAKCARNILHTFFSWVTAEGLLGKNPVNPVIGTRVPRGSTPRERWLSSEELVALWRATEDDWRDGDEISGGTPHRYRGLPRYRYRDNWPSFCGAIRLLSLLGARHNEIVGMLWSELDFAAGTWTLPAARSKNGRPLTLVLPAAALAIVKAQPHRPGNPYVFSPQSGRLLTAHRLTDALNRRLGDQVGPWRIHDLRRSVATGMANIGVPPHIVEAALNHVSGSKRGVAGTYNRSQYTGEVTAALERWSQHLLALAKGRSGANIIPLRTGS